MGSLFDGIGGFPLAAIHNGVIPLWASEIEPFPIRVTQQRLPGMLHYMDMLQLDEAEFELIQRARRGECLYKCGMERYHLEVKAPTHKAVLFGSAGGR